jgi:hypothetical protein
MLTEGWDANTVTHILGVRARASANMVDELPDKTTIWLTGGCAEARQAGRKVLD